MADTKEILELERRHFWPPYTQASVYFASEHPVIERADGVFLYDTEGNRYYDMISSWWVNLHGHNHPVINAAIAEQVQKVSHCAMASLTNEPAVRLAAELAELCPPDLSRVFFSDDGSTAVEVAMKMAFQYFHNKGVTGRTRFAAFTGAYHGDTLGTVALGGVDLFHKLFKPTLIPVHRAPAPPCHACPHGRVRTDCDAECFAAIEEALLPHVGELVAVIVEPVVQGAVGMQMYSPKVLTALRRFCDKHDILLIDDEVAMAFGRTGRTFAFEHAGIVPDIVCAAKGLTGGYLPLAVTIASEEIYQSFLGEAGGTKTFYHGHSFTGNPLGAAAARASMRIYREERLPQREERLRAFSEMMETFSDKAWAHDVRWIGMVGALDIKANDGTAFDPALGVGRMVSARALREGVYLRPLGDTIYFLPPLSITRDEMLDMAARVGRAVESVLADIGTLGG